VIEVAVRCHYQIRGVFTGVDGEGEKSADIPDAGLLTGGMCVIIARITWMSPSASAGLCVLDLGSTARIAEDDDLVVRLSL
jgi:hypothetical protein